MTTIDDVYRSFGYAAEAAQLLETELGTLLFRIRCEDNALLNGDHSDDARAILDRVNRLTLGALIDKLKSATGFENADIVLAKALAERNRLMHHFYREHNNRRNSSDGCALMVTDLETIHAAIFSAYELVQEIIGTDLDDLVLDAVAHPTRHLKLD